MEMHEKQKESPYDMSGTDQAAPKRYLIKQ